MEKVLDTVLNKIEEHREGANLVLKSYLNGRNSVGDILVKGAFLYSMILAISEQTDGQVEVEHMIKLGELIKDLNDED